MGLPFVMADLARQKAQAQRSPVGEAYRPASASYCSMMERAMRPRGETSRPLRCAHSRMASWFCSRSPRAGAAPRPRVTTRAAGVRPSFWATFRYGSKPVRSLVAFFLDRSAVP